MRVLTTKQFEKDLKRHRKRGKNLDKLWNVIERLLSKQPLDPRHRRHRLIGDWSACWECHIEPDWLLIWSQKEDTLHPDADRNPCRPVRLIIRREKHLRTADVRTLRVQGEAADLTMLTTPRENSRIPLT